MNEIVLFRSYFRDLKNGQRCIQDILRLYEEIEPFTNPYLFRQIFLMACLNGVNDLLQRMFEDYERLHEIDRSGLRPVLIYGKYVYRGSHYPIEVPKLEK